MADPIHKKQPDPNITHPLPVRRGLLAWLLPGLVVLFLGAILLDGREKPAAPFVPGLSTASPMTPPILTHATISFPATWTPSVIILGQKTVLPTETIDLTTSPTPTLPASAEVNGIIPRKQSLPLDCEANDATLLAGFLGFRIDELQFQEALPKSDNPNRGFVGDVYGIWGSTPPGAYGAHASPVAITLRRYHVPVLDVYRYSLANLKRQLIHGYPVMVWVTGHVKNGRAIPWHSSDGYITYVAPFEHTVLVVGYDEAGVTILDNLEIYHRSYSEFMDSWSVLGYMAIIKYP